MLVFVGSMSNFLIVVYGLHYKSTEKENERC